MQKTIKALFGCLIVAAYFIMFLGSATQRTTTTSYKPGWYGITEGWNNWVRDVDGQVGYQLFVSSPKGRCEPSKSWSANSMIVSGTLPPGLTLNSAPSTITGIPRERGHWLVKLKMYNIECGGLYYKDFEQELNFHITGSGKVNN
jgi:hypothetical protein